MMLRSRSSMDRTRLLPTATFSQPRWTSSGSISLRSSRAVGMDGQDLQAVLAVGQWHMDLAAESPRPQQCRVQHVQPVRGADYDDILVGPEAVELDEELVERLLALIVAVDAATALGDGVDLVDEHDALARLPGRREERRSEEHTSELQSRPHL